jgi:hypothetical protein
LLLHVVSGVSWGWLELLHGASDTHLFQASHPVTSHWYFEVVQGGRIYTTVKVANQALLHPMLMLSHRMGYDYMNSDFILVWFVLPLIAEFKPHACRDLVCLIHMITSCL